MFGSQLTQLRLSKMICLSFPTLAAIKTSCPALKMLEIHVYDVISGSSSPLDQAILEAKNGKLENLVHLKISGFGGLPNGNRGIK